MTVIKIWKVIHQKYQLKDVFTVYPMSPKTTDGHPHEVWNRFMFTGIKMTLKFAFIVV